MGNLDGPLHLLQFVPLHVCERVLDLCAPHEVHRPLLRALLEPVPCLLGILHERDLRVDGRICELLATAEYGRCAVNHPKLRFVSLHR